MLLQIRDYICRERVVSTNQVSGTFYTPSSTISLNGTNSLTGNVTASNLIVNGQNGGTLFGTVTGTAALGPGANGIFTLNGQVIGASPTPPNPSPNPSPNPNLSLRNLGVILDGVLPYPYGETSVFGNAYEKEYFANNQDDKHKHKHKNATKSDLSHVTVATDKQAPKLRETAINVTLKGEVVSGS